MALQPLVTALMAAAIVLSASGGVQAATMISGDNDVLPGCLVECHLLVPMTCGVLARSIRQDCRVFNFPTNNEEALDELIACNPLLGCSVENAENFTVAANTTVCGEPEAGGESLKSPPPSPLPSPSPPPSPQPPPPSPQPPPPSPCPPPPSPSNSPPPPTPSPSPPPPRPSPSPSPPPPSPSSPPPSPSQSSSPPPPSPPSPSPEGNRGPGPSPSPGPEPPPSPLLQPSPSPTDLTPPPEVNPAGSSPSSPVDSSPPLPQPGPSPQAPSTPPQQPSPSPQETSPSPPQPSTSPQAPSPSPLEPSPSPQETSPSPPQPSTSPQAPSPSPLEPSPSAQDPCPPPPQQPSPPPQQQPSPPPPQELSPSPLPVDPAPQPPSCWTPQDWPVWLPLWEAGDQLLEAVWERCPTVSEELLQAMVEPKLCCAEESDVNIVGAIGNGLYSCEAACIYNPLPSRWDEGGVKFWVWDEAQQCWTQDTSANPCSLPPFEEAAWNATSKAYWVAAALVQRLATANLSLPACPSAAGRRAGNAPTAVDLATCEPELAGLPEWCVEQLANTGAGRNLTMLGDAVLEAACTPFAREVLLELAPDDPLRLWEEQQAGIRGRDCERAMADGISAKVTACLCDPSEPLIYCRAWEAREGGLGLESLTVRPSL